MTDNDSTAIASVTVLSSEFIAAAVRKVVGEEHSDLLTEEERVLSTRYHANCQRRLGTPPASQFSIQLLSWRLFL